MSKPSCRRLSVAPLAGVERQGCGSLCSGSLAVGISHSLPSDFYVIQGTHPFSSLLPQLHQGQGFGGRSQLSSGERGCRASSPSLSRLLQPSFCGDEGLRVVEAGDRPFVTEPEGVEDVFQDGDSLLGVWGCLWYPALISAGWGWCLGRWLSFAPCSCCCPLSGCSSLRLRVLGGSWFSPLCSPNRRSASRSTCPALPPVSRLSFRLGDFSFG